MTLPRDNLYRAMQPGLELREDSENGSPPTLVGHFAVFNQWTEINSTFEGRFMERIAPGAFSKTFAENRDDMKVLFQHGRDPQVGDKPLGQIVELSEDKRGAAYEVPLLDTTYNRDLLPGLKAGLYGSSFRFQVMREEIDNDAKRSSTNPDGLPERTITEARVMEFGPVTFPAYTGATAGVRSLTDEYMPAPAKVEITSGGELIENTSTSVVRDAPSGDDADPETGHLDVERREPDAAPSGDSADQEDGHPDVERRGTPKPKPGRKTAMTHEPIENVVARQAEIRGEQEEIDREYGSDLLPEDIQARWDELEEEYDRNERRIRGYKERQRSLERKAQKEETTERVGLDPGRDVSRPKRDSVPDDIYAVAEYRSHVTSVDELADAYREGAKRALDAVSFPHEDADKPKVQEHIQRLLDKDKDGTFARRMLETGSPVYRRAFAKQLAGVSLNNEEQRALSLTTTQGGFAVPFALDPTIILTSNGVVNPIRAISRVETITTNEWRGVSSAGVTAAYAAEATEASDNAPTLAQPVCFPERAQAFIPFSREIGEDWGSLESEMARLLQDAKDTLEADKFVTGLGHASVQPQGLLVGGTAIVTSVGTAAIGAADLYALEEALPPRFRPQARYIGNRFTFNKVRQIDTAGGANLWVRLDAASPPELIGYPAHEISTYVAALTTGGSILTIGDFNHFLIVDRVGMSIELIPHLFGTANNRPTGQRGLYAYWRNSSQVLAWQAFRTLKTL